MNIDVFFLIALLFGGVRGFSKGLLLELTTFISLALGVYGALRFSFFVADALKEHIQTDYLGIIAFGATFLTVVIIVSLIGKTLTKIIRSVGLGFFNKTLGFVFGALKFALIFGGIMLYVVKFNENLCVIPNDQLDQSVAVSILYQLEPDFLSHIENSKEKANEIFKNL